MSIRRFLSRAALTGLSLLVAACATTRKPTAADLHPTAGDGGWFLLKPGDLKAGTHHTRHAEIFGKYVTGYNLFVLEGIDTVQAHALDGGGYFIGKNEVPTESPIGYSLRLFDQPLLDPPRATSYCSGATYGALIETLNRIFPNGAVRISPERLEAVRMQEPDGGRREDQIKFWGHWNDDGFGSHYALVQYSGIGIEIQPEQARPGDFMNISWKSGNGHSVVFLGWVKDRDGQKRMLYWASQKGTNGYGDQLVSLDRIKDIKAVRLERPDGLFTYDIAHAVERKIPGDPIRWD